MDIGGLCGKFLRECGVERLDVDRDWTAANFFVIMQIVSLKLMQPLSCVTAGFWFSSTLLSTSLRNWETQYGG